MDIIGKVETEMRKQNKKTYRLEDILFTIFIFIILFAFIIDFSVQNYRSIPQDEYNLSKHHETGLYFPYADTYCVDMKGRTEQEINDTDRHEYCHWLIDIDNVKHFCAEKN